MAVPKSRENRCQPGISLLNIDNWLEAGLHGFHILSGSCGTQVRMAFLKT